MSVFRLLINAVSTSARHMIFEEQTLLNRIQYLEPLQAQVKVKDGRAVIRCALPLDPLEADLPAD